MESTKTPRKVTGYGENPIAIIGIGCRFPGGANGPRQFWNMLANGLDAVAEAPATRPGFRDLYDSDPHVPGRLYSRWGGFLENVELFDANFFGVSPREASRIDPQHRLLLELMWEACEDAGLPPSRLAGSRTGVFIGISTHDYGDMQMYPQNREEIDLYSNSGTATSIAANRISYMYDLRGPSMAVDTACSSALTAVHLSCQSLRSGECDIAVAGGVQMVLTPELSIGFCKASMLSRDGRCKAFDNDANGYVRGEGAGLVLLKPLSAAISNGDPIYAVIRGTAINEDGRTQGMTLPSRAAQQAMLEAALAKAQLSADDIQYVEAHGPGTAVGDPIEAAAIGSVMSQGVAARGRCAIGSVKTNIGHLEAASGIAGLIKVALALKHRQIPPSLHFHTPNRAIDFDTLGLRVVTELEPWPDSSKPAIAGVNSFGFGGANAHAILQEAPKPIASDVPDSIGEERSLLLVASARSAEGRTAISELYSRYLTDKNSASAPDTCFTAAERRAHHEYRLAIVAPTKDEFAENLSAFASGDTRLNISSGRTAPTGPAKLGFIFSGMGPQWWAMGQQLCAQEPVFRASFERCDEALRKCADWSLTEEFAKDETVSRVASPELAQVTNFAIQVALADLWASYGIVPNAVMGHSGGAMAAAYIAGVYSVEDAIRLCYHRSRLQGRPSNSGKMLAVGAPFEEIRQFLQSTERAISLAAVNGPSAITLAGDPEVLEKLSVTLQEQRIFTRMLPVNIAYHSPAMDKIKDEFLASVADLRGRKAGIPLMSDTTGTWVDGTELDADYWWNAIRKPVLFAPGMQEMITAGVHNYVEISPHPVLSPSILECLKQQGVSGLVVSSIRRKEDERESMLRSLGALYCSGYSPNWSSVQPAGHLVPLPGYPWQRERHWFESAGKSSAPAYRVERKAGDHPLLGGRMRAPHPAWESAIGNDGTSYLRDHVVQNSAVFPAAAYLELAFAARGMVGSQAGVALRKVEFFRPLVLNGSTALQFVVHADGRHFEVFSTQENSDAWVSHARGVLGNWKASENRPIDLATLQAQISHPVEASEFYKRMADRGLVYGPVFRGIQSLWNAGRRALGRVRLPELNSSSEYQVHPALLDAAFQLLVSAADTDSALAADRRLFLPIEIREARLHSRPGNECWALATMTDLASSDVTGDVVLFGDDGKIFVEIRGLKARLVEVVGSHASETVDQWLYEYRWEPKSRKPSGAPGPLPVSLLADAPGEGTVEKLRSRATALAEETGWRDYYDHVEERLNDLATAYVAAAFRTLGVEFKPGTLVSTETLTNPAEATWRASLAKQCCAMLQRAGVLHSRGSDWETTGTELADPQRLAEDLLQDFPRHRLDVELLARCGPRLQEVITGKQDGRDFLFTEEGFNFLESFYRESPASAFYNTLLADVLSELIAGREQTRPLYALEVGAGTGGSTSHLLPKLNGSWKYVFTDASPVFLENAQSKFGDYRSFGSQIFDITQTPGPQGLEPRSFDLIIGANVVHATPHLENSIGHLQELLAPGGVLLLLEITTHPYWLDIAFGSMEGWWSFEDRALRPDYALLSGGKWQSLLEECGLQGALVIADTESVEPAQSILLAHAPDENVQASAGIDSPKHWLIFADRQGRGEGLSNILRSLGYSSSLIYAGDHYSSDPDGHIALRSSSKEDVIRLREELQPCLAKTAGVIHLWSLDIPAPVCNNSDFFDAAQDLGSGSVTYLLRGILPSLPGESTLALVTAGAQPPDNRVQPAVEQTPVWGLGRVILKEMPLIRCRMIDLSPECDEEEIAALAEEILRDSAEGDEEEVALRGKDRFVHRLRPTSLAQLSDSQEMVEVSLAAHWRAEVLTPGSLDSLVFRETEPRDLEPHQVEVAIEAAGLNFRDVVLATNIVAGLESDNTFGKKMLGSDFSGRVTRCGQDVRNVRPGDEVFGIAPASFGSFAITDSALVAPRSTSISPEDAATIPVAFLTAWYGLKELARLTAGESVLIHAASGGVGLAAIQIAKLLGATIFATASSTAKREYLKSLGIEHVMDSRSLSFADEVREYTFGRGVDVVLNSLPGEALEAGIGCLAPYGRFVELGKADIYQNQALELGPFKKNLSLFAVDLDRMSFERPKFVGEMLLVLVSLFQSGSLSPLPATPFAMRNLPEALRFLGQAKHIGKVVVRNEGTVPVRATVLQKPPVRPDATYLISGGLGGVGLSVADWLVEQGARSLVLIGRNAPATEAKTVLDALRSRGITVEVMQADVSCAPDVKRVTDFVSANLPPLRGVIHAAMVLDDISLADLSRESLDRVMLPKILGAWNLHSYTSAQTLDFFVSFSSITSLMGNPQQGNYAAANAFLDSFSRYRRAHGLPATTINWGVISGTGYVARHPEVAEFLGRQGYLSFTPEEVLDVLGEVLKRDIAHVMAAHIDWKKLHAFAPRTTNSSRIRHLIPSEDGSRSNANEGSIRSVLQNTSPAQRAERLEEYLRAQVGRLLGGSRTALEVDRPISDFGLDSLVAAELTVLLDRDFGVQIDGSQLLSGATLRGLGKLILQRLLLSDTAEAPETQSRKLSTQDADPLPAIIDTGVPVVTAIVPSGSPSPSQPAVSAFVPTGPEPEAAVATSQPRLMVVPSSTKESTDYHALDYTRWSPIQRIVRGISKTLFRILAKMHVEGIENIPIHGPCVLAINHLSMTEVPLLLNLLPRRAIVLVHQKWQKVRVIDWFISRLGQAIYVSPGEPREESLRPALAVLEAGGILSLAPEGTRSRTGGLQRGRTGAAYLAVLANVPVVPLVAWGHEQWVDRLKRLHRVPIQVRVGEPIRFPAGPANAVALRDHTESIMLALAHLLPPEYRGVYNEASKPPESEILSKRVASR